MTSGAYAPTGSTVVLTFVALVLVVTFLTYVLHFWSKAGRKATVPLAWSLVIATAITSSGLTESEPAGVRMVMIILSTLISVNAVILAKNPVPLRFDRWIIFVWLWPGMRPQPFLSTTYRPLEIRAPLVHGIKCLAIGLALMVLARLTWNAAHNIWLSGALALVSISMSLHFGFLNILVAGLRGIGIAVEQLFKAPLKSTSLQEFWGSRWNLAFNQMTSLLVFIPLLKRVNAPVALLASFVFSGILHELAISVPVEAGYGLPTLYFVLQGLGVLIERRRKHQKKTMRLVASRTWVFCWLVLPIPLVFHGPFLTATVWPLFQTI